MTRGRVLIALLIGLALAPAAALAQATGTITGRVTDRATGQPLSGVQVFVTGTQRGALSGQNGQYRVTGVPTGAHTVRASIVGYGQSAQQVSIAAGQTVTVNFTLASSAVELEGVVVNAVTGQAQRRAEVGTNVAQVNVAEIQKGPITQASDVLQGRIAGVTMQGASGQAGSGQRIRIRGANSLSLSNDPLIYIDGALASNSRGGISLGGQDYSRLNDINPEDIQNIEILKGPAATGVYGTAAANGVVLITTRRGRAGAPQWRAYVEGGRTEDVNDYPLNYIALQAFDRNQPVYNQGYVNTRQLWGANAPYSTCPNYLAALPAGTTGACTQDVRLSFDQFRDARTTPFETGETTRVGLSVSGGSENLTYYISGDRQTEFGVIRPNDLERISLRSNLRANVGERATVGINASYVTSNLNRISSDNSVFSPLINAFLGPAQYVEGMETDTLGSPGARPASYFQYNTRDQKTVTADQSIDRFMLSTTANFQALSWLTLNGNAGLDFFSRYDRQTQNPNQLPLSASYLLGFRDSYRADNYIWTANASAASRFHLTSSIASTTTLGLSWYQNLFEQINCYGAGIPAGTRSCGATTSLFAVNESYTDQRTLGIYLSQELAFGDRLFLAGSIRADNNSGLTSGLIYYPSASVSWVVSNEPFFPQTNLLSQLRLRAAAGQSGLRPGYGQSETLYGSTAVQLTAAELPALVLTNTGNRELVPERTAEYEAGADLGFFDDRLGALFTYYNRRSEDALVARNLPPSGGLSGSVFENLGRVRNSGTELELTARVLDRRNLSFNARLNLTSLSNKLEKLGEGIAPITFNRGAQAHREGFPLGAFFALPIKYNDADKNGLLSRAEVSVDSSKFLVVPSTREISGVTRDTLALAYVGPSLPTNTQGLSLDLTLFRNFTVSTLFERRGGAKQLNYTEYFRCRTQGQTAALFSQCSALGNPDATLKEQAAYIGAQFIGATPYGYIEDSDFIKWRELAIRVGVPDALANRFPGLRGAALSFAGRNLKTWTDYTGLDPEITEGGGGANFSQNEFNTQPPVRVYVLRLDFNF